jgi:hypothetical protein
MGILNDMPINILGLLGLREHTIRMLGEMVSWHCIRYISQYLPGEENVLYTSNRYCTVKEQ